MADKKYVEEDNGGSAFHVGPASRHTREKEAVRLAQTAYREFHVECFWSFDPAMEVTITKVDWVIERLVRHGRAPAWKVAERIKELLAG